MKVGHMDGMHYFIDRTSILVKIKSVSYNCRTVYIYCIYKTHKVTQNIIKSHTHDMKYDDYSKTIYCLVRIQSLAH